MFGKEGQNSSVWKDKKRIPMFERTRSEFEYLEGEGTNSHVWKDKTRIPMFERIGQEFQCFER